MCTGAEPRKRQAGSGQSEACMFNSKSPCPIEHKPAMFLPTYHCSSLSTYSLFPIYVFCYKSKSISQKSTNLHFQFSPPKYFLDRLNKTGLRKKVKGLSNQPTNKQINILVVVLHMASTLKF